MPSVKDHFVGKSNEVKAIYNRLITMVKKFGPVEEDAKKTSIHLNRQTAFAGVAARNAHLVLTIKSDQQIKSRRIFKSEKTSAKRYHHEFKLGAIEDVDAELQAWLKSAYDLSAYLNAAANSTVEGVVP